MIFISYRIADTLDVADRLAAQLQQRLGSANVFFDRRSIEPGSDWPERLRTAVEEANVLLVLIGSRWLTEQDEFGERRLNLENDWVRREVETGLAGAATVIPVLVNNTSPPPAAAFARLPTLEPLAQLQALPLRTAAWDADFEALLALLTPGEAQPVVPTSRSVIPGGVPEGQPFVGREAELQAIAAALPAIGECGVVVVHGPPGVGKSELAREYARQHQGAYTNGAFVIGMEQGTLPIDLAAYGARNLGIVTGDRPVDEQCELVLRKLDAPTLLIYDNVESVTAARPWLPTRQEQTHIIVTTVRDDWDGFANVPLEPLDDTAALDVIRRLGGDDVAERYGEELVQNAGGLPIQLCPAVVSARKALRVQQPVQLSLSGEAHKSFSTAWEALPIRARTLMKAATLFNPDRIRPNWLRERLSFVDRWTPGVVDAALNECLDASWLQPGPEFRMHRRIREFVCDADGPAELGAFRQAHLRAFRTVADLVDENPADTASVMNFMSYATEFDAWSNDVDELGLGPDDLQSIGAGLTAIGFFAVAQRWYERAASAKRFGISAGNVSHQDLGVSLHLVGWCLSESGDYASARNWFERAVAEKKLGDAKGRVDHDSLGASLHLVGWCLSESGSQLDARVWYERAVTEKRKGDSDGRVDHESLSTSLHQVGHCCTEAGDYEEARTWFESAVAHAEQGDAEGRVDHDSLGLSLQEVGWCLSQSGDHSGALTWYERALAEKEKGDKYGRIDYQNVGEGLHQIGWCLSETGEYLDAKCWYERAAVTKGQGDIHSRVDHESVGMSLHQVGWCFFKTCSYEEAASWHERAATEQALGDIHGRVNRARIGMTLHQVGVCMFELGEPIAARRYFERAASEKDHGNIHGFVDYKSLSVSLREVAKCLTEMGDEPGAAKWLKRAEEAAAKAD